MRRSVKSGTAVLRIRIEDAIVLTAEANGGLTIEAMKQPAKVTLHPTIVRLICKELGFVRRLDVERMLGQVFG